MNTTTNLIVPTGSLVKDRHFEALIRRRHCTDVFICEGVEVNVHPEIVAKCEVLNNFRTSSLQNLNKVRFSCKSPDLTTLYFVLTYLHKGAYDDQKPHKAGSDLENLGKPQGPHTEPTDAMRIDLSIPQEQNLASTPSSAIYCNAKVYFCAVALRLEELQMIALKKVLDGIRKPFSSPPRFVETMNFLYRSCTRLTTPGHHNLRFNMTLACDDLLSIPARHEDAWNVLSRNVSKNELVAVKLVGNARKRNEAQDASWKRYTTEVQQGVNDLDEQLRQAKENEERQRALLKDKDDHIRNLEAQLAADLGTPRAAKRRCVNQNDKDQVGSARALASPNTIRAAASLVDLNKPPGPGKEKEKVDHTGDTTEDDETMEDVVGTASDVHLVTSSIRSRGRPAYQRV